MPREAIITEKKNIFLKWIDPLRTKKLMFFKTIKLLIKYHYIHIIDPNDNYNFTHHWSKILTPKLSGSLDTIRHTQKRIRFPE